MNSNMTEYQCIQKRARAFLVRKDKALSQGKSIKKGQVASQYDLHVAL